MIFYTLQIKNLKSQIIYFNPGALFILNGLYNDAPTLKDQRK